MADVPVVLSGFLGSLVASLFTGAGALLVFARTQWSERSRAIMLAAAAGIMLGATVFSLLLPAADLVEAATGSAAKGAGVAGAGTLLGATAIWLLHRSIPHEHFVKGREGGAPTIDLGRHWLFILAITLHNLPEGMSVGVSYGTGVTAGFAVTLGIGIQNLPEGLAVAAALIGDGSSRLRAFTIALLTGLVEPLGGLVGATAVSLSDTLLPWGLAVAAGAMLFVVSGEVIPETHRAGGEQPATFALVIGFVAMMFLDMTM